MNDLSGRRVLIVEDEAGVALLIEDMLLELGCEIAASAAKLARGCELARTVACDLAILDINLDGEPAFPVARILAERKIPFLFSTGYGSAGLPDEFKQRHVLSKPFTIEQLEAKAVETLRVTPA
ncbi:MAG: response regulator [Vitreimonas sp.]